jgi:hypothetical protein
MPREVEALRTALVTRLSALEKALADPKQHGSLESLILDLARTATEEAHASARHAVIDIQKAGQQAVAAARAESIAALEAEKVESGALRQVIENAKSALAQAEAMLKEQRRAADTASQDASGARRELDSVRGLLEEEQLARVTARRELEVTLAALEAERARASAIAEQATQSRAHDDTEKSALAIDLEQHRAALETERAAAAQLLQARSALEESLDAARRELDGVRQDAAARTHLLSQSQSAHDEALKAAQDAARYAEARLTETIRERDAVQTERVQLQQQLEAAEAAFRASDEARRELEAAHEARDAAEVVEHARQAERHAEPDLEADTVVDLTSITQDDERQLALEQRTRALEQALREAEARAESAELELERHRQPAPVTSAPVPAPSETAHAPMASAPAEQFRGPARGARRVAIKVDISLQVDGNSGKLVDLSVTGAQVLTPSTINPNRLVTVSLPTTDGVIACKAKVMWSRLEPRGGQLWYRAGVQFTTVDQRALEVFLSTHQT